MLDDPPLMVSRSAGSVLASSAGPCPVCCMAGMDVVLVLLMKGFSIKVLIKKDKDQ